MRQLLTTSLALLSVFAVGVSAKDPPNNDFKLFGHSQLVTGGISPDTVVAELTSNCGAQPYSPTCYLNSAFVYSGAAFVPDKSTTLNDITKLSTDYNMNGTDCMLGSPRVVIFTASHNYTANIGQPPFGGGCYFGWQNTGNLTSLSDPTPRWQVDLANTFVTWSAVEAAHGTEVVKEVDITLDGGYGTPRGQDVLIDNFTVNKDVSGFRN